ncbi:hypothetical protein EGI16_21790 [Chryseobacterium sp. G0240]|uniref:hypothetical protein n=1 Tax=Chryseobacterium sp. G0240 TaxID=2487066 RepID=UPI000F45D3FE|nr:hypothetical protein [Chryseobacterium sp. G0240]ROH98313.1 hypothetical protein EGI16_21790 [Chryseobacterium sp. G0240]
MIIKELLNDKICFAVVQSYCYLTKHKIMLNQEWEIIASNKDSKDLKRRFTTNAGAYIPENQKNPKGIISYTLDLAEIKEFRSLKDEYFTKVMSNENGTVWEVKQNSFKKHFKKPKREAFRNVS